MSYREPLILRKPVEFARVFRSSTTATEPLSQREGGEIETAGAK